MDYSELKHNLDLIKIHQEIIQIQEKTRTEMGNLCPPYIIKDINDRKQEVKRITTLIIDSESVQSPVYAELQEVVQKDDVQDIHLFKVIELVQVLLENKNFASEKGGTIISNSKNVVTNSQITANSIHIGDIINIETLLKQDKSPLLTKSVDELKLLISKNKIKEVLEALLVKSKLSPDLEFQDSVIALTNRWNKIRQKATRGLLTEEEHSVGVNRLVRSMLEIMNSI